MTARLNHWFCVSIEVAAAPTKENVCTPMYVWNNSSPSSILNASSWIWEMAYQYVIASRSPFNHLTASLS
ncbi:hypothetical protein M378DRAFT_168136 [Amanita muscaria Koide BX008]|uniref:Uncharacterized protein n=1 Tax=Amanita muscaria (strain Koide BX008) TaxID=946122 RepID=A0A0C2T1S0_AMAMK|nr:hypothetical protein M378DRAFT_168136 [Amanita muscaria Koide BX008]